MRKVPQPVRLYMPPRLATVRYEDRVGHLTLSWATCCFSLFDGTLNLIGYTLGCYFWMVSGRDYIPRLLYITV